MATDKINAGDILERINSNNAGRYGEGRIVQANQEMKALRDQVDSGQMSMSDYLKIAGQIIPQVRNITNNLLGSGSKAANAANSAGAGTFLNNYAQEYDIQSQALKSFGRTLNSDEFAQIAPAFQGPNGTINGNAALAQLKQTYKLNPSLDPGSAINTVAPSDVTKQITNTFQSTVGRAPTANELSHFQQEFQKGALDAYGLEGVIKQSPEYTNAQDAQFRTGLNDQLANYDAYAFNRMGAPQIFSQYAQNGMPAGTSPSLEYALTDLMGRMSQNRSNYLAQLSAQQYSGNKNLATQNYQDTTNQLMNNWAGNLSRSQNMNDFLTQRGFQGMDYNTQKNDYLNYLNNNRQPNNNMLNYLNTGANVAGTAAGIASLFL